MGCFISAKYSANSKGTKWDGEKDTLIRLFNTDSDKNGIPLPKFDLLLDFFTLQDAVEFVEYAEKTTIDTMKFQNRPETVGGPIDILVIKPDEQIWLSQKKLHL